MPKTSKRSEQSPLQSKIDNKDPSILYPVKIVGHGKYLPKRVVNNQEIAVMGGSELSSRETKRTGVQERHFCDVDGGENLIQNGAKAVRATCAKAGINLADLDLVVGRFD